jgi:hypothetical protein
MRKALLFASLLTLGVSAYAQDKKGGQAEFTPSGDFRVRFTNDTQKGFAEDVGTSSGWESRFKVGGTFRLGDKITGSIGTIHQTEFGAGNSATAIGAGDYDTISDTTTANEASSANLLLVNEAYGKWMLNDNMALQIGRFHIDIADGSVVATDDNAQVPNTNEGWAFMYDLEFAKFSLYSVLHKELDTTSPFTDDEAHSWILSADIKSVPDFMKTANIHAVQSNVAMNTVTNNSQALTRYGFTVGGDVANILYNVSYSMVSGVEDTGAAETDIASSMMDIMVGYSMPDMMKFKVMLGYHSDTGDDDDADDKNTTYSGFMYDKFANAGLMDVLGWGNLTDTNLKVSLEPMENLGVELAYHMFSKSEKAGDATILNGTTENSPDADATALGTEIDLTLTQKYSNGMNAGLRYSTFTPGEALVDDGETHTQWQLFTSASF